LVGWWVAWWGCCPVSRQCCRRFRIGRSVDGVCGCQLRCCGVAGGCFFTVARARGFAVREVLSCVWTFGGCLALDCALGLMRWWGGSGGGRWVLAGSAVSVAG
jgi:hypothetical protein